MKPMKMGSAKDLLVIYTVWPGNVKYNKRRKGEVVNEVWNWLSETAWASDVPICGRRVSKVITY